SVAEVSRGVGNRHDIRQLFELERQLKGGRVVVAATDHAEGLNASVLRGILGDPDAGVQRRLQRDGELAHLGEPRGVATPDGGKQGDYSQLSGIGLGGGNATLRASV